MPRLLPIDYSQATAIISLLLTGRKTLQSSFVSLSSTKKKCATTKEEKQKTMWGGEPVRLSEEPLKVCRHLESMQVPLLAVSHIYI